MTELNQASPDTPIAKHEAPIKLNEVSVEYADPLRRLFAWLIDVFIALGTAILFIAVIELLTGIYIRIDAFILIISVWIIGFLYAMIYDRASGGQTFGKLLLGIKTVDDATIQFASFKNSAIDAAMKFSPLVLVDVLVGVVKNSGSPEKRLRLSQNLSKTVVIKA